MADENSFAFEVTIQANSEQVSRAFTSASALREWLCDVSTTSPVKGGRIFLAWDRGYFASGSFTHLDPGKRVAFTWIGKDDPERTLVDVHLTVLDEQTTRLALVHSGLGIGPAWDKAREEIRKGWAFGLKNLKSILEDGRDLRVTERPLIGIYTEDYGSLTDQKAQSLNVPVDFGVLVVDVVHELGAERAGIQAGDLIVALNGKTVDRLKALSKIMSDLNPGDQIEVGLYRGQERLSFTIETMSQKVQPLPDTLEGLAKEIENRSSKALDTLDQILEGVSEAEASFSPGPEEWSIKEVLVHLIHNEREVHAWVSDLYAGQERSYDEWPGNQLFRIRATLATYPSLNDLMAELRRSLKETVASVAFIDPTFTQRKASYWRLGTELLGSLNHLHEHITQIENNIHTARIAKG